MVDLKHYSQKNKILEFQYLYKMRRREKLPFIENTMVMIIKLISLYIIRGGILLQIRILNRKFFSLTRFRDIRINKKLRRRIENIDL